MPALRLACLAYLSVALPGSTLGLLWPSMRLSFGEPVGALGLLLAFGLTASVISSVATGRILSRVRVGPLLALGTMLSALAGVGNRRHRAPGRHRAGHRSLQSEGPRPVAAHPRPGDVRRLRAAVASDRAAITLT